jgi:hypothetical protein
LKIKDAIGVDIQIVVYMDVEIYLIVINQNVKRWESQLKYLSHPQ